MNKVKYNYTTANLLEWLPNSEISRAIAITIIVRVYQLLYFNENLNGNTISYFDTLQLLLRRCNR